jgi:hypothetical protein
MAALQIVLAVLGACFFASAYCISLARLHYKYVRAKGYANPLIVLAYPSAILLGLAAGFLALRLSHREHDAPYIAAFLVSSIVLASAGLYTWARWLPPKARVGGNRNIRFPYRLAGWLLIAAGVGQFFAFGIASRWKLQTVSTSLKLLVWMALPAGAWALYLGKRVHAPSAGELLDGDSRPPVLYLRPFTLEERDFVALSAPQAAKYTSNFGARLGVGARTGATFEQFFGASIAQLIGPFVALGNPLDYAPPEGAARTYERDENWKERFQDLARRSACIIVQVGESRNLAWELEALRLAGFQEKMFVFTSPSPQPAPGNRLGQRVITWTLRLKGVRPVAWSDFVDGLLLAGYKPDQVEPPPGSIVSFNREGSLLLLATGAREPGDFLPPVLERLAALCRAA